MVVLLEGVCNRSCAVKDVLNELMMVYINSALRLDYRFFIQNMFDPFLKSFFVRSSDPSFVKELKLHILTSLVSEANVHIILRELQVSVGGR